MSWLDDMHANDPAYPAPGTGDPRQAPPTADWAVLAAPETSREAGLTGGTPWDVPDYVVAVARPQAGQPEPEAASVPLYRTADLDDLAADPGIDWDAVGATPKGHRSPLVRLPDAPPPDRAGPACQEDVAGRAGRLPVPAARGGPRHSEHGRRRAGHDRDA